jgi:hypothetical protein
MMAGRQLLRLGSVLMLAGVVLAAAGGAALAQDVPVTNQGPRFGHWGPGAPPPAAGGPVGAPPPTMPRPGLPPPPQPNYWGGCSWGLQGNWQITGHQNAPYYRAYTTDVIIYQYGNWLRVDQPDAGYTYYGQCTGDSIELDVYAGSQFVGYENGTVDWSAGAWQRWRGPRIRAYWQSFVPSPLSGTESWHRDMLPQ